MLPTPPTDINAQWNYLSKIIQDIPDKLGVQSTSSKSHEIIFSPYWHFLLIAQVLHKVLVLLFHTEGLMCYIKSLTHNCPQKQWNILELKVPLPVLSSRPQQPCRSVWALWLQNAVRNFNLFFLQGKNFNIMSHVVLSTHKQINRQVFEIRILYSGFQVNLQFSSIQSSHRIDKTACCMK